MATRLGAGFKLKGSKVVKDVEGQEKRLDVSTRIRRRTSKKVRVVKPAK